MNSFFNQKIKRYILENRSIEEIQAAAMETGMKTLREIVVQKMQEGMTSPEEVIRITQELEE